MTTSSIREIWKLLEDYKEEIKLLKNKEALALLIYVSRHRGITQTDLIKKVDKYFAELKSLIKFLLDNDFIELKVKNVHLSGKGEDIVKVVEYSKYDISDLPPEIIDGYILETPLGKGSTSVTYKATIKRTGRKVALKIFKPGILDHISFEKKIKDIVDIEYSYLVIPYDWDEFIWNDTNLKYVVMKYVEGDSLKQFLEKDVNIDLKNTLKNFVLEIGEALKIIKNNGFMHGDLHENNILVEDDEIEEYRKRGIFHFKVIDFIGINLSEEFRKYEKTDFEYFKENFFKIIRKYCTTPSGEIDRKKLGERFFYIHENLIEDRYTSIEDVINGLSEELPKKKEFHIKDPFTYLIFENYDVKEPLWLKRFKPDPTLYSNFTEFKSLICSGPRGGGKTIYMRSLSFVPSLIRLAKRDPKIKDKLTYFTGIFGIYFPCRQGEFKYFSDKQYDFKFKTQLFLKHILILKIIRKTISLISDAYEDEVFTSEPKVKLVLDFLSNYILKEIRMTISAREIPFKELVSILENEEDYCIDILGDIQEYPTASKLFNENILIEFFKLVKKTISELSNHKFYIIFDDVSEPQVNLEVQKILNCLIACPNETYCCKFSTDKYAYTFEDMFGKALQLPHDYTYIDMSTVVEDNYGNYLEKIINKQLEMGSYTKKIKDYLENLPYSHGELVDFLSKRDYAKVRYAGWDLIVQLSSYSVRDGLAICDSIFKEYGSQQEHEKLKKGRDIISVKTQNRGIIKYSGEVYMSLIDIASVGKKIFDIVRNFGAVSREYLKNIVGYQKGKYLFDIDIKFKKDIENKKISSGLENIFKGHGLQLSRNVEISPGTSGIWKMVGSEEKYLVIADSKQLKIYTCRKYEMITIERRDAETLSGDAENLLAKLIRHSVFLNKGFSFSIQQMGLVQKFTLHKKYTPNLRTTYREREHLRLSKNQLEKFLLKPDEFREEWLKKLKEESIKDDSQLTLYDFKKDDKNDTKI